MQIAQQLRREKKEITMGKGYYERVREEYKNPNSAIERCQSTKDENADEFLVEALTALHKKKSDIDLLSQWSQDVDDVTESSASALYQSALMIPPMKSLTNACAVVAIMQVIAQRKLHTKYPEFFQAAVGQLDTAAVKHSACSQKEDFTSRDWWTDNKDWTSLIVHGADVQR